MLTHIDFNTLADVIKIHENSLKFPYGCEHRVHGELVGYTEFKARQKCIALCLRAYNSCPSNTDYFKWLNHFYAADKNWYKDIEHKYEKTTIHHNMYNSITRR